MICAHDFEPVAPRQSNRSEVIFRVDEIPCRSRFKISGADAAGDGLRRSYEQAAALSRRFISRMREHVAHDSSGN